jgi:phytoene dehydrogenase-like protein
MTSFDAIVVGGGHNGLTAAAYLSRAGLRVCVLERRELLGAGYATPVRDLWLCGSSTHPGGAISGAPGRNAAVQVLRTLRGPAREAAA